MLGFSSMCWMPASFCSWSLAAIDSNISLNYSSLIDTCCVSVSFRGKSDSPSLEMTLDQPLFVIVGISARIYCTGLIGDSSASSGYSIDSGFYSTSLLILSTFFIESCFTIMSVSWLA